jgi:hypothetical protein
MSILYVPKPNPMRTYFIRKGEKVSGPFTLNMIQEQELPPGSFIRHSESDHWQEASEVEEMTSSPQENLHPVLSKAEASPVISLKPRGRKSQQKKRIILLSLLFVALITGLILFTLLSRKPSEAKPVPTPVAVAQVQPELPVMAVANPPASKDTQAAVPPKPKPAAPDKAAQFRKNWSRYIKVSNSNYAYGVIGGIHDLSVTFTNNTDFMIDEMTAEVNFIKSNGKVWKTKMVTVYNIPPHGQRQQEVPKVNRSKSVEVTVQKIRSTKMQFCYTEGQWSSGKAGDPYLCK